jgi:thioredoxin-related protein
MAKRLIIAIMFCFLAHSVWAAELVMVEQPGCAWCAKWDHEVSAIYPLTPEGQAAPLRRVDLRAKPDDLTYSRSVVFTPTFLLMENGVELARIEGYPGEDFFWGLLGMLLKQNTDFKGAS